MFSKILFPVDMSEPLDELREIFIFMEEFGIKKVFFLHNLKSTPEKGDVQRIKFNSMAKKINQNRFEFSTIFTYGHASSEISDYLNQNEPNCVVIPWRKKFILTRTLLGSTTKDVVRLSEKPVIVYKKIPLSIKNSKKILCAVDSSFSIKKIIPYLDELSVYYEELFLLDLGEREADPLSEKNRKDKLYKRFDKIENRLKMKYTKIHKGISIGNHEKNVISLEKKEKFKLILINKIKDKAIKEIINPTAEEICNKTICPVLVVQ